MTFDVFAPRDQVVGEYAEYFKSFVHIIAPDLEAGARREFEAGCPWPDVVLHLDSAYEAGGTLTALAAERVICAETARFFRPHLPLCRHQGEAPRVRAAEIHTS